MLSRALEGSHLSLFFSLFTPSDSTVGVIPVDQNTIKWATSFGTEAPSVFSSGVSIKGFTP
jgi:hypothetical protein